MIAHKIALCKAAQKGDILRQAKHNATPKHVLRYLQRIEVKSYGNVNVVLEAIGDFSWDHD